jgi:hypothetical protein
MKTSHEPKQNRECLHYQKKALKYTTNKKKKVYVQIFLVSSPNGAVDDKRVNF